MKKIETDPRVKARASGILRRYWFAERGDVENRLSYALAYAGESFDPSFGMPLRKYEDLCLQNCASHLSRSLAAEAKRRGVTDTFEKPVADGLTLEALLADHRHSERRMLQLIGLREYLATLEGTTWFVVVAALAGYRFSEIARHYGVPRTSFDRLYGPAIDRMREIMQ